jgi:hypothetical protein
VSLLDLTLIFEFIIGLSEGALGASCAALIEECIRHDGFPLIDHERDMWAAICHGVLREAYTCDYLVGHDHNSQDLNWYFKSFLELGVVITFKFFLILTYKISGHMIIVRFFPSLAILLSILPDLRDRLYCF